MLLQSLTGVFALSAEIASDFLVAGLSFFTAHEWEENKRRALDKWLDWGGGPESEE